MPESLQGFCASLLQELWSLFRQLLGFDYSTVTAAQTGKTLHSIITIKGIKVVLKLCIPSVALQIKLLTSSCGDTALKLMPHSKHQLLCLVLQWVSWIVYRLTKICTTAGRTKWSLIFVWVWELKSSLWNLSKGKLLQGKLSFGEESYNMILTRVCGYPGRDKLLSSDLFPISACQGEPTALQTPFISPYLLQTQTNHYTDQERHIKDFARVGKRNNREGEEERTKHSQLISLL